MPSWIKPKPYCRQDFLEQRKKLENVATVCVEANCPNRYECFSRGVASFMLLGRNCTRSCRYCNVTHGTPLSLKECEQEVDRIVDVVCASTLSHVVLTCVTRDDLADGGASLFVRAVQSIRTRRQDMKVEVLVSDFGGDTAAAGKVIAAGVHVFNHNIETVPRLYPALRPGAQYTRSLGILRAAAGRDV
ncbi:MAG: lipoyl synthase, partial [Nanoarchaeota archaeon]